MHISRTLCIQKGSWTGAADEPRSRCFLHTLLYTHLIFNFCFYVSLFSKSCFSILHASVTLQCIYKKRYSIQPSTYDMPPIACTSHRLYRALSLSL
jgi:hypothetical protein